MPSEPAISLLDLPNELLLYILSSQNGLSSKDIYNVAFISRRLLSLSLNLFLSNEGIRNPEEETSIYVLRWSSPATDGQPDALAALNALPDISRIKRFRCFFQDPSAKSSRNFVQQAFDLSNAVTRVSRFVNKLRQVDVAEIYLVWDPYYVSKDKHTTDVPLNEVMRWTEAFRMMVNSILEKGCMSLTIQYDPSFLLLFHFRSTGPVQKAFSYLKSREDHFLLRWELEQREGKSSSVEIDRAALLSSVAQAKQSITSLSIHSPALLTPPFVNWTLSLLHSQQNLTSLSFAYISFPKETWALVLPIIADAVSTRLTKLQFLRNCPHLDSIDLLHFIAHLPNLTSLSIDRTFRVRFQNFKSESKSLFSGTYFLPKFLRLSVLKAPVELVSILIGTNTPPPAWKLNGSLSLPNLRELTVYPSSLLIHPPSYVTSSIVVNELLAKLKTRPSSRGLVFSLDAQMEFTDFQPVFSYIQNINNRREFQRALWETLSEDDVQKLTESGPGSTPHICFDYISHLILYKFNPQHPDEKPRSLCLWLHTLFPRVERLTFTCRLDAQPHQDVHMDDETIQSLIKSLQEICLTVRVLVVDEKSYAIR
ncbi:hypothetical protein BDN70DRAFT_447536 [Pholiota conissans]|uniref:F-box domain-containing protein n=1 Tax=Pholiota conissans TaxID=109636 RepID=A0A9P5YS11_9AGAR|nr:hypothetical protein BDN70DRAFT_447536 [Pholiota conissans]